ncbi:hypothetical protein KIN20_028222 [Parelaphostrongylus tenuis]|uniref:C2H2-type domain-containing protein n=1 Tax=Parelaphostrongylus tenuis TaxID=148309 RepID=A0AAD5R0Q8_PARTN|nr:hypothetical protein KIN20_028222 [Parelaphostrongylus tenuis]
MIGGTRCGALETGTEAYEIKPSCNEDKLAEPPFETRKTQIVEEVTSENSPTVKKKTGENRLCRVAGLLNASLSNFCENDISPRYNPSGNLPSDEEKVLKILQAADVNLKKEEQELFVREPEQCLKCGRQFAFRFLVLRHMSVEHTDERDLTCGECGRKFARLSGLRKHKQVIHRNYRIMCPYEGCGHPGFRYKKSLTDHIRAVHTHVRPYVCTTCGKAFVSYNHLKSHSFTHSSESTFHCKCGVKFRHKVSLNRHKRLCLLH